MLRPLPLLAASVALAWCVAAQEPGFVRVTERVPPPALEVAERDGALQAEGDRLVRRRGDARVTLRCTHPRGLGRVVAMVQDRLGTTWVATEHGLFAVRPEHDVVDALDLRDGVPRGTPVGIAHDGTRRLWVATADELGCIDCAHGFGRTRRAGAGLPAGPFTGLGSRGDTLLLAAGDAVFAVRPRATAPVVRLAAPLPGGVAAARYGEPLRFQLASDPDATFRYRLADHHLLRPLPGADVALTGLKPTVRALDVYALDPDLNLSAPLRIPVAIPNPPGLRVRPLVTGAAIGGALLLLALLVRARRAGGGRLAYARAGLTAFLLGVVGLQVVAGFMGHGRAWPFMAFTMYAEVYREDDLLYKPRLVGIDARGGLAELSPAYLGFMSDSDWQPLVPLLYEPGHAELYREAVKRRYPDLALTALEVRAERVRLTRAGPVRVPAQILWRMEL